MKRLTFEIKMRARLLGPFLWRPHFTSTVHRRTLWVLSLLWGWFRVHLSCEDFPA